MELTTTQVNIIFETLRSVLFIVVGASLTPLVNSIIAKRNIKRQLRPDLTKNLFLFFKIKKIANQLYNFERAHSVGANSNWNRLRDPQLQGIQREEIIRQYNAQNKYIDDLSNQANQQVINLTNIETDIVFNLSQIQQYYGTKVFNKINDLLEPILDRPKTINCLDYDSLFNSEAKLNNEIFKQELAKIEQDITEESKLVLQKIGKLF